MWRCFLSLTAVTILIFLAESGILHLFVLLAVFLVAIKIQGVSWLVNITDGDDFLGLCDQKSSYKHVSDVGRLRSYGRFLIPVHALFWTASISWRVAIFSKLQTGRFCYLDTSAVPKASGERRGGLVWYRFHFTRDLGRLQCAGYWCSKQFSSRRVC